MSEKDDGGPAKMTKRERELFASLKRLHDAIWDADLDDSRIPPKLNRAYIAAGDMIRKTAMLSERTKRSGTS